MAFTQFNPKSDYEYKERGQYQFLPFRFKKWDNGEVFLSNEVGEFHILSPEDFQVFIDKRISPDSSSYFELKSKHFLADKQSSAHLELLASKYRTKKGFLEGFTKLHIFVTSLRCNQSCPYCQVSRQGIEAQSATYDMSPEILKRSVQLMLSTPAQHITMEFQGGEPLVNFDLVKEAILLTKDLNKNIGKDINYVICTNLSLLNDEHLSFFEKHKVLISTSLDGPEYLHNQNRPLGHEESSHGVATRNIRRAQEALGKQSVSALMTTTKESLKYPKEIVDEYLRMDMGSLFVRELNPYGFATKSAAAIGYAIEDFTRFYKEILSYIIEINRAGRTFSEANAAMILTKLLTPWPIGFVDLQSPSGAGIGVCLYNYNGDMYVSDESRMLAEVGDQTFRMGNVLDDSYEDLFFGETMQMIASASCNEALAGCSDCAYQSYCGADPVRHYRMQKDIFGNRASSDGYCKKNMFLIEHNIDLFVHADKDLERILWAWVNREDVNRMGLPTFQSNA